MITLTENAIGAVQRFLDNSDTKPSGLRISINGGGCSGFQYGIRLDDAIGDDDVVIDCGAIKVLVDPMSAPLLDNLTVDFVDSIEGSGFKFVNPNASATCACGSSFSA